MNATIRVALLSVQAFVAVTAAAGGAALIAGSVIPTWGFAIVPPAQYLEGSPFASYVVPGLLLLLVVGGSHAAAFWFGIRRPALVPFAAATGGYICLIWIFVQMIYIPFSFLQAVYFVAGLVQVGLSLVLLGVFDRTRVAARR